MLIVTCILNATICAPCVHPMNGLKFEEVIRVPLGYTLMIFFWENLQWEFEKCEVQVFIVLCDYSVNKCVAK